MSNKPTSAPNIQGSELLASQITSESTSLKTLFWVIESLWTLLAVLSLGILLLDIQNSQTFWIQLEKPRMPSIFANPIWLKLGAGTGAFLMLVAFLKNMTRDMRTEQDSRKSEGHSFLFFSILFGFSFGILPLLFIFNYPELVLQRLGFQPNNLYPQQVTAIVYGLKTLVWLYWIGFTTIILGTLALLIDKYLLKNIQNLVETDAYCSSFVSEPIQDQPSNSGES